MEQVHANPVDILMNILQGQDVIPLLKKSISRSGNTELLAVKVGFRVARIGTRLEKRVRCTCGASFESISSSPYAHSSASRRLSDFIGTYSDFINQGSCVHVRHIQGGLYNDEAFLKFIHAACWVGNLELSTFLSSHGCSLTTSTGQYQFQPLHLSILGNQIHVLQYLLTEVPGIDTNALCRRHTPTDSFTPLMIAVESANAHMVSQLLLCKQTNVNRQLVGQFWQSALDVAVHRGNDAIVELLILAEASCNMEIARLAVSTCSAAVVNQILMRIRISVLKSCLQDLLTLAIRSCDVAKLELIFTYISKEGVGVKREAKEFLALVLRGEHEMLQLLFKNGWTVSNSDVDRLGYTLLDYATALGWKATVDVLKQTGCTSNSGIAKRVSPYLSSLVENVSRGGGTKVNFSNVWIRLFARGFDVNQRSLHTSITVLHHVVVTPLREARRSISSYISMAEDLLRLGADPDMLDCHGYNVLASALCSCVIPSSSNLTMIALLLQYNASLDFKLAVEQMQQPYKTICSAHGFRVVSPLLLSVAMSSKELSDLFVAAGCDVYGEDLTKYPRHGERQHIVDDIAKLASSPGRLNELCRTHLRRHFRGPKLRHFLESTEFPEKLRRFVLLEDIIDDLGIVDIVVTPNVLRLRPKT